MQVAGNNYKKINEFKNKKLKTGKYTPIQNQ